MKYTTIFTGFPVDGYVKNFSTATMTRDTTTPAIPTDNVKITKITFTFFARIYSDFTIRAYDVTDGDPNDRPLYVNNYYIDSEAAPAISETKTLTKTTLASGGEAFYFNALAEEEISGDKWYDRVCGENASFKLCFCSVNAYQSYHKATVYGAHAYTCTVEWQDADQIPNPPTNVTASPTSVGPGQSFILSWTAATMPEGANNTITGYRIGRRSDSAFLEDSWGYDWDADLIKSTSTTITAPTTTGTYYYCPRVETSAEGYALDACDSTMTDSSRAAVQVTASNTGTPTKVRVNNSSTLYIGESNIPTLTLSWTAAASGTNNPVKDYTIYKDGVVIGSTETTTYSVSDAGSYTVVANPTIDGYGSNTQSSAAKVIKITTKPSISFTSSIPTATGSNLTISWSAATAVDGATISYLVYQDSTLLATQTATSYTFDISKVTAGNSFTLKVVPRYIGASNSYTEGAAIATASIIRASGFSLPSPFWTSCYDNVNGYTSGVYNYAHASILLGWAAIEPVEESEGTSFIYSLEQQIDGSAFTTIGTYNSASQKIITLSSYAEGTLLGYRMKITNNFGISVYSDTISVQKVISPSLSNLNISNISSKTLQSSFEWERNLAASADDLEYKINVIYDNQSYILDEGTLDASSVSPQVSSQSIDLSDASFSAAMSNLYNKVITQKTVYPVGTLQVILNYKHFQSAQKTISSTFSFNYITSPENFGDIAYDGNKDYYNPGDIATVLLSNFSWKDAAGGTSGGEISNYLSSSYSINKFVFNNNSTSVIAPNTSNDLVITLTLKTQITYADVVKEYTTIKTLPFRIARWTEESVLIDGLVLSADGEKLEGYIQLPENLCSSSTYNNLQSISPTLFSPSSGYDAIFYTNSGTAATSFTKSDLSTDLRIKFEITNTEKEYSDVSIGFSITFINTSNSELIIKTNSYRYFVAEIDMAVRKGRVGINVANDFSSSAGDSTLQINAGAQTGTNSIVEILSDNVSTTGNLTTFLSLSDGTLESKIFSDGEHIQIEHFICSVLYSDDEQSFIKVENEKINVNDSWNIFKDDEGLKVQFSETNIQKILTDSNYLQYFNGAISSVLSSNLSGSLALVSDANGKITTSEVSSAELSYLSGVTESIQTQLNKKFDSTISQNAKTVFAAPSGSSGIPFFRQLTFSDITTDNLSLPDNSVTANVFMGNGIRYGSDEPTTNLVVGQIWLKPKSE